MTKDKLLVVKCCLVILTLILIHTNVHAADIWWTGGAPDSNWSSSANWSTNSVPASGDNAHFDSTSENCFVNVLVNIQSLYFSIGYTGTFSMSGYSLKITGNADFTTGGTFSFVSTDSIYFYGTGPQTFKPHPGTLFPFIVQQGAGSTTVTNFGFHASALVIANGTFQHASMFIDTVETDIYCTGGTLSLNNSLMRVKGNVDFRMLGSLADASGKIVFIGSSMQNIYPKPASPSPSLDNYNPTTVYVRDNHCVTPSLFLMSGQVVMETSLRADSLVVNGSTSVQFDDSIGNRDTVFYHSIFGSLDLRNSEVCFGGSNVNLSSVSSLTSWMDGSISFIGSNQSFTTSSMIMYKKIKQKGSGITTVLNNLLMDTLEIVSGEFNLGNGRVDSLRGSVKMNGGTLNFGSSTLKVASMYFDLNGPGTIIPANGSLEFSGMLNHIFFPRTDGIHPRVKITGMTTTIKGNHFKAARVDINAGTLAMDTSLSIDTLHVNSGATLQLDTATGNSDTIKIVNGNGSIDLRNSELCFNGSTVDLSMLNSVSGWMGGSISFIGNNQSFIPGTWQMYQKIIQNGSGPTTVVTNNLRVDTLELRSGEFNLGSGRIDSVNNAVKMNGGTLNFNNSILKVGSLNLDMSGSGTIIPGSGKLEFSRNVDQYFKPSIYVNPNITMNGYCLRVHGNVLSTPFLSVTNGSVITDSVLDVDSLFIGTSGSLFLDTTTNVADTFKSISGTGNLHFGKADCFITGNANLSNFANLTGSADITFASADSQKYTPKVNFVHNSIIKVGMGKVIVDGNQLMVNNMTIQNGAWDWGTTIGDTVYDTLTILNATMTLSSNHLVVSSLYNSSGQIELNNGKIVRAGGNGFLMFGDSSNITSGTNGYIEFNGSISERVEFYPGDSLTLLSIVKTGTDTVVLMQSLFANSLTLNSGYWDWGTGLNHTLDSLKSSGGSTNFRNSSVNILIGNADFSGFNQIVAGSGTLRFLAPTGTQILYPNVSQTLPSIIHAGNSTLRLSTNNLICHSFEQYDGNLDFNGVNVQANGNCYVTDTDSLIGLGGRTIYATGDVALSGSAGKMLYCNPSAGWNIGALGSLSADYTILSNCNASNVHGIATINSVNSGNNTNWYFVVDTLPPDNDLVLHAIAIDTNTILLKWNPWVIDSSDLHSVIIWIDTTNRPDSAHDSSAVVLGNFSKTDSVYTLTGLKSHNRYYFAISAKDSTGNIAPFSDSSFAMIKTKAAPPVIISCPDSTHFYYTTIFWQNPAGLTSHDSVYIHGDTVNGIDWSLLATLPYTAISAQISMPQAEGKYKYMLSTSFDSAGTDYLTDACYDTVTYSIHAPVISTVSNNAITYRPALSWIAPAGMTSSDSFFIYIDTLSGVNNWHLYGKYGFMVNTAEVNFNRFGTFKYAIATNWDSTGSINTDNVDIDSIVLVPSSRTLTWDISDASGYQSGNGVWGSENKWSADGVQLTRWLHNGYTARFSAITGLSAITLVDSQYVDSIIFDASNYVISGGTLKIVHGAIHANAIDTIKSAINADKLLKRGVGELALQGTVLADTLNVECGKILLSGTHTVKALSVESGAQCNAAGVLSGNVLLRDGSHFSAGVTSAGTLNARGFTMSPSCTLTVDIGTTSDTIKLTDALILDGILKIRNSNSMCSQKYIIFTCGNSITNNILNVDAVPSNNYSFKITADSGKVILAVDTIIRDSVPPAISIQYPDNHRLSMVPSNIYGTAYDASSGLRSISIMIYNKTTGKYWNSAGWIDSVYWIPLTITSNWTSTNSIGKLEGNYIIKAAVTDSAGYVAYDTSFFMVDTTSPIAKVTTNGLFNASTWTGTVSGIVSSDSSGIDSIWIQIVNIQNTTYWNGNGWSTTSLWNNVSFVPQWTYSLSGAFLSATTYKISVYCKDKVGNTQYIPDTQYITYDPVGPSVESFIIQDMNGYSKSNSYKINISVVNSDSMRLSTGFDSSTANWKTYRSLDSIIGPLNEGLLKVYAQFKDKAGNVSNWVYDSTMLDTTAPVLTMYDYLDSNGNWTGNVSGIANDIWSVVQSLKIQILNNTGLYWSDTFWSTQMQWNVAQGTESWNFSIPVNRLTDGVYIVRVIACDRAMNTNNIPLEKRYTWYNRPVSQFTASPLSGAAPLSVTFFDSSKGSISFVRWELGDGTVDTTKNMKTHIFYKPGTFTTRLIVKGPGGIDSGQTVTFVITNTQPAIHQLTDTIIYEGMPFIKTISVDDINFDSITTVLLSGPQGLRLNGRVLEWTASNIQIGNHTVIVSCKDSWGASQNDTFVITVKNISEPPVLTLNATLQIFEDSLFTGTLNITDPDVNDTSILKIIRKPSWITIEGTNLTGIPRNDDVGVGNIELICSDRDSFSDTLSVKITVINTNDRPGIGEVTISDTMIEKREYTGSITVSDQDFGDSLSVSLLTKGVWIQLLSMQKNVEQNAWIIQSRFTPQQSDTGTQEISIQVTDRSNAFTVLSKKIMILDADDPPQMPVVTRKFATGAVQYSVLARDDRDNVLMYVIKVTSLQNGSIVYSDSSSKLIHPLYPLIDGAYSFTVRALDVSGFSSVPCIDTFTISKASTWILTDTSWNMISAPATSVTSQSLKNSTYLLHWDESGVDKQVFSFYKKKEEIPSLEPSKSYWRKGSGADTILISRDNFVKDPVTIKLNKSSSGWNQIASPYPYPVVWPRGNDILWLWNPVTKDYEESPRILEPWKGYWVRVDTASAAVVVPQPVFNTTGLSKLRKAFFAGKNDWNVQISLSTVDGNDADNRFGFSPRANDKYDIQDRPEPPRITTGAVLYFPHSDWNLCYTEFASDIRKEWKSVNVFEIAFSGSNEKHAGKLSFDGLQLAKNVYCYMIDNDSVIPVTSGNEYQIKLSNSVTYKTIFVTDNPGFNKAMPLRFAMGNPYPNPFCPSTKINYTLPYRWDQNGRINLNQYVVSIEIYDVMGRKVRNLVDRKMNAGHYSVTWDGKMENGRIVASGNYYCILKADDLKSVKQLMLVK